MAKHFPYVTIDGQCCGLATISGIGFDHALYQDLADDYKRRGTALGPDNSYRANTEAVIEAFDKLMVEFNEANGRFKPTHAGYACTGRSAVTCAINEFQLEHFGEMFERWGWTQVAKFRNRKSGKMIYIMFLARAEDQIIEDEDE